MPSDCSRCSPALLERLLLAAQVSVGWCIYNLMAPVLLVWHKLFQNRFLTPLVNLCAGLSTIIVIVIIVIIWVILPQEYNYGEILGKSLDFYAAQRSGVLPADNPISWRGNSALTDISPTGSSLVGGYYDNGGGSRLCGPVRWLVSWRRSPGLQWPAQQCVHVCLPMFLLKTNFGGQKMTRCKVPMHSASCQSSAILPSGWPPWIRLVNAGSCTLDSDEGLLGDGHVQGV